MCIHQENTSANRGFKHLKANTTTNTTTSNTDCISHKLLYRYCIPNLNIFPSFMVILVNKYDNDEAHKEEIIDASKAPVLASNNKAYIIKNLDTI